MTLSFVDSAAVTRTGRPDFAGEVSSFSCRSAFAQRQAVVPHSVSGEAEMRRHKGKGIPVQTWTCREEFRSFKLPDCKTISPRRR
jgi:hypothetical protein